MAYSHRDRALGFAPVAVVAGKVGVSIVSRAFKKPTPRTYGRLPGTIIQLQEGVEGRGRAFGNDVQTVALMDKERKVDAGMQGIWTDLLPTWSPTPAAMAEIQRRDPGFRGGVGPSPGLPQMTPSGPTTAGLTGLVSNPLVLIGVAAGAFFLLRGRRRG